MSKLTKLVKNFISIMLNVKLLMEILKRIKVFINTLKVKRT